MQILNASEWWYLNRPAAPALFDQSFTRVISLLAANPQLGHPYPVETEPGLRRILIPETGYHIYYVYRAGQETLFIVDIWSTARGKRPKLTVTNR